jgi:hypothetical protein
MESAMKKRVSLLVLFLCGACYGGGGAAGRFTVMLSPDDGTVIRNYGDTTLAFFDLASDMIFRFEKEAVTAARLDNPEKILWQAPLANPSHWFPLAHAATEKVLAVESDRKIVGLDKATGKPLYTFDLGNAVVEGPSAPLGSLYLIDNSQTRVEAGSRAWGGPATMPEHPQPAKLSRFDIATGKIAWVLTSTDEKASPIWKMQPGGVVLGGDLSSAAWFFDEQAGRPLDKPPVTPAALPTFITQAATRANAADHATQQSIEEANRTYSVVSIPDPQTKGFKIAIRALQTPGDKKLWEYQPAMPGPDGNIPGLVRTRAGILVHVNWIRLD